MADTRAGFDSMQRDMAKVSGRRGRGPVLVPRRGSVTTRLDELEHGSPRSKVIDLRLDEPVDGTIVQ
jgi:hypothetical protein